jgi:hypothetical protein
MLSGIIEEFGVHNTVQLAELMTATGRLSLVTDQGEYALYYDKGELVHAEAGSRRGDDAVVFALRKALNGRFELDQSAATPERSVTKSIQLLILLAAKAQDEEKAVAPLPPPDRIGSQLEDLVGNLHLFFASYVADGGLPVVRINPENAEQIDMQLLCSMTDSYLSKVEVERMLGTTRLYQFAIGRAGPGWLFLGSGKDVPLAMLGTMLRKAIGRLEEGTESRDATAQQMM